MKKALKIIGVTIGILVMVFVGVGLVLPFLLIDFGELSTTPTTVKRESPVSAELSKLDDIDNMADFEALYSKIEALVESADTITSREAMKAIADKETFAFIVQSRENEARVKKAKKTYPEFFQTFNGSYYKIVDLVKRQMNDPSSFKHIDTRWEYGSGYRYARARMEYSGKNAFGGRVKEAITVKIDINGNIFEIE